MAKGLALDADNDIILSGTGFKRVDGAEYVAQKIRSKLQLIYGESTLDTTAGIDYFSDIFVKPVDLPMVASIFKENIIETDGVNELLTFDYDLDTTERHLTISFSVNTDYGDIDVNAFTLNLGA